MNRSLQWRLSLMLGGAILLSGLVAVMASFTLAYLEAKEFQDDILRQIAHLATQGIDSSTQTGSQGERPAEMVLDDAESRFSVVRIPGDPRPEWLQGNLTPGFHSVDSSGGRLRVFVHEGSPGNVTVVAQSTDARDEIATNTAWLTLVPLLLLLPVIASLVVRIVRGELAPVSRLAGYLDGQPANRPSLLSDEGVPDEIVPFVHAINRLLHRIISLMGQQRRFVADAAHELRSPLTALSVQAQNLLQAGSLDTMRERVLPLQAGIERARKLTEQLLSLARTQTETGSTAITSVSVMARELISEFLPFAEARGIDLGLEEAEPLSHHAAPETLRLVLRNALENSLKYVPDGGEVTLRICSDSDSFVIEIVDNGPGIPALERERVFDPFYRMPGTTGSGSGLGLTIAYEAAVYLGGSVSLHDRTKGSGLVFRYRQKRMA